MWGIEESGSSSLDGMYKKNFLQYWLAEAGGIVISRGRAESNNPMYTLRQSV